MDEGRIVTSVLLALADLNYIASFCACFSFIVLLPRMEVGLLMRSMEFAMVFLLSILIELPPTLTV